MKKIIDLSSFNFKPKVQIILICNCQITISLNYQALSVSTIFPFSTDIEMIDFMEGLPVNEMVEVSCAREE